MTSRADSGLEISTGLAHVARLVLETAAIGAAVVLVYCILIPGSRAASPVSVSFYYVTPAIVLVVAAVALFLSPERQLGASVLLVCAVGSLLAAEVLLRLVGAGPSCGLSPENEERCQAARAAGVPFDTRSKLEVVDDLRAQGQLAWPAVPGSQVEALEVLGEAVYPMSPGIPGTISVLCNESGFWTTFHSDEFGFRNPSGMHEPGNVDIAIVGDSFAIGSCVRDAGTIAGHLGRSFGRVLNLGWQGSGPLIHLAVTREYATPVKPRFVVWVFFAGNDMANLEVESQNEFLTRYLEPGYVQGLREKHRPLVDAKRHWMSRREETRARAKEKARRDRATLKSWMSLTELRSRISDLLTSDLTYDNPEPSALFTEVAERMRDDVTEWGGELLFVYLPSPEWILRQSGGYQHRERVVALMDSLRIDNIDLLETLAGHPDPPSLYPFRMKGHFTEEGYGVIAATLARAIHERCSAGTGCVPNDR